MLLMNEVARLWVLSEALAVRRDPRVARMQRCYRLTLSAAQAVEPPFGTTRCRAPTKELFLRSLRKDSTTSGTREWRGGIDGTDSPWQPVGQWMARTGLQYGVPRRMSFSSGVCGRIRRPQGPASGEEARSEAQKSSLHSPGNLRCRSLLVKKSSM